MTTPQHLALAILADIFRHNLIGCRSYEDLNEHCDANCLGTPIHHAPTGGEGDDAVQAFSTFVAGAQAIVAGIIGAAPGLELVTILDDADVHVFGPAGFSAEITHYDKGDPTFEATDPAHASLIEAGEHPHYRGYQRLN